MVMVVLLAEVGARAAERAVPAPLGWRPDEVAFKVEQIDRWGTGSIQTVFLGSSIGRSGLKADQWPGLTGAKAYNASLGGASMRTLALWAEDVVLPGLRPEVVVLALSPRELNDAGRDQGAILRAYLSSPARSRHIGHPSLLDRLSEPVRAHVAVVRGRHLWRLAASDPAAVIDLVGSVAPPRPGPSGDHPEPASDHFHVDRVALARLSADGLNGYEPGGVERAALARLVRAARAAGARVVVVDMPYDRETFVSALPHGAADVEAYDRTLAGLARDLGVEVVDARASLSERSLLRDVNHLNGRGAARLTALVASRVRAGADR